MTLPDIYKALRCNSKGVVRDFRSDWRVDRNALRRHYTEGECKHHFIHVANPSNTQLWFIPTENLDTSCKHLFGYSTPRRIMTDVASIFSTYSFPDGVIQYFDGDCLLIITHDKAVTILKQAAMKKNDRINMGCRS